MTGRNSMNRSGHLARVTTALVVRMSAIRAKPWLAYPFGLVLFGIALGARFAATMLPPRGFPFLTFFPAVILSALVGGLGPGIMVAVLSTLSAWYFFISPARSFGSLSRPDLVALVFFVVVLFIDVVVIHVMTVALDRVREERERNEVLSRAKSRLMTSVGHDLRQPLNVVSLALSRLGKSVPETPENRELLARTRRNVDALAHSFEQLMELARLESEGFAPNVGPVPLEPLCARLRDEFGELAAHKDVSLVVESSDLVVRSDREMLLSILRNLVGNGVKYTPPRGSVRVTIRDGDGRAHVEVKDTGPGIPKDKLESIFEEFERLDPGNADGMGLGLSLVKRTAHLLGHRVSVDSTPGEGATFSVEVSLA